VLAIFLARLLVGEPPVVYEDGLQSRDFVSVHDVARAVVQALEAPAVAGAVLNVASGRPRRIGDCARTLAALLGSDVEPTPGSPWCATPLPTATAAPSPWASRPSAATPSRSSWRPDPRRGHGTVLLQAAVLPDSKPSPKAQSTRVKPVPPLLVKVGGTVVKV
jgi:nucleoside-diphosphate-sugar epimerase